MLNRIFVGLAIVASIFVAAFGFFSVKPKIEKIVEQRNTEKEGREKAEKERDQRKKELDRTTNQLKATQTELTNTKADRDRVAAEAKKEKDRADKNYSDYREAVTQRDDARAKLFVWDQLGVSPDQIKGMLQEIKDLNALTNEQMIVIQTLQQITNKLTVRINGLVQSDYVVPLPPDLRGKVVAVDPKWDFVVLDVGTKQGALEDGELLVHRNGQVIAKVRITKTLQDNQCVANVVAGYRLHDVLEGDAVFPAHN
jgi:F0F1-type ATP synthase membrane subunit b/b'